MCIAKDIITSVRRQTVNPKKVPGDQRRYNMVTSKNTFKPIRKKIRGIQVSSSHIVACK